MSSLEEFDFFLAAVGKHVRQQGYQNAQKAVVSNHKKNHASQSGKGNC
jgi:hypothetical protein